MTIGPVSAAVAAASIAFAGASAASSNTPAPPPAAQAAPCSAPEFRQMDFWVGVWDVRWAATPGQDAGQGTNTITRILDNCVIQEQFSGGPTTGNLIGHSVSTYHAAPKVWRQTWVDNQGGYFALTGGPTKDGKFILENTRLSDAAPFLRMVFEDIKPDSLTWRWQRSSDKGATWTDSWVINYTKRK